jgi:hypothetical protein
VTRKRILKKVKLLGKVAPRTVGDILNLQGRIPDGALRIIASAGWAKKVYSDVERKIRLAFGRLYAYLRYRFWKNVVFCDETDVPYVSLQNWEAYMAQAREHIYKEEGTAYANQDGIVRGKHVKKAWTGSSKMVVAMQGDQVAQRDGSCGLL